jgi:hypothetical protein
MRPPLARRPLGLALISLLGVCACGSKELVTSTRVEGIPGTFETYTIGVYALGADERHLIYKWKDSSQEILVGTKGGKLKISRLSETLAVVEFCDGNLRKVTSMLYPLGTKFPENGGQTMRVQVITEPEMTLNAITFCKPDQRMHIR